MSKIFLSHTSIDKPFVRKIAADLRSHGHTVWIDEAEINIGDSLIGKIRNGLDSVDYVAVILSKASIESEWVKKELEIASNRELKERRVLVLPIKIEDVELPGFLEGKFYGDFSNPSEYNEKLQLLLRSLGDSKPIEVIDNNELERIQLELESAKEIIKQHKKNLEKVVEYSLSAKSDELQERIKSENKSNPEYEPINNVYAFQMNEVCVTLGYLLFALQKSKMRGGHPLETLLTLYDKWTDVERMFEAYYEMIQTKE